KSATDIQNLVQRAVDGHYNAIVIEVMGYQDGSGAGHGAYWNSAIVPRASDIVGSIDPLGYLCQLANAQGIQVHAWLVTYRAASTWPFSGNPYLASHPEFFMVPRSGIDADPVWPVGSDYVLDPGSPDVQEYLIGIVRELVSNYPIKGINWDYIRYTQIDAGYPARSSYNNSGLKRFQRIYNRSDIPSTSDSQWNDFRRREIDELVRRCRAEIASIKTSTQPIILSADVLATGSAPADFTSSLAYRYYQNWKLWAESGWLDAVIPMNYKREHCSDQATMFRSWVNAAMTWRGPRHAYCGQATYLNSFANSVTQMQYIVSAGAQGAINYSYVGTRANETICDGSDPWSTDWGWYPYVAGSVYASAATLPTLPWRDPATATEGTIWGRVLNASFQPVDDASVTVFGRPTVKTDGNGYYVVTLVPATAGGVLYAVTASRSGVGTINYPGALALAGDITRYDFALGAPTPQIVLDTTSFNHTIDLGQTLPNDSFSIATASGCGPVNYRITDNAAWLSVSPSMGTAVGAEQDLIAVNYALDGLDVGSYAATITIIDPGASNSPRTVAVTLDILTPPKPGDFDRDDDVDVVDYGYLQACLTGVGIPQTNPGCENVKMDGDNDVDEVDVQLFINCLSGPGVSSSANCLN
ncbi:MAG: family 10 glycosylhydrolase, partial [Planctomycetes bacterium]|nr:family 10 glycosylhydrolase [Planctomycetota bacterium]